MTELMKTWVKRSKSSLRSILGGKSPDSERSFDPSRRALLTGVAAVVACGAAATMLPTPAGAQYGNDGNNGGYDDDDDDGGGGGHGHGRRRSRRDHSRRRSRRDHGRRRSRGHGRRRSRRQYRDWNEECFPTPFGWVCF